jgi:hypothetical protein
MRTKRPQLSSLSQEDINLLIVKKAKQLKLFTVESLLEKVRKSTVSTTTDADFNKDVKLADDVRNMIECLTIQNKVSVVDGEYQIIPGKRGRKPKAITEAVANG